MPRKIEVQALCFWCGSEMGLNERDEEEGRVSPKRAIISYKPCKSCDTKFKTGITLFESQATPFYESQPPLEGLTLFPSGRWITLPPEAVQGAFDEKAIREFKSIGMGFVSTEIFGLLYANETEN